MLAVLFHPSSYLGIVVFLVLTGCGMPIPEEVAYVVAGVLSAEGHMHWPTAFAACLIGAVLGDSVMYWIGRRWGDSLLGAHPRLAGLVQARRDKRFEAAIEQHAFKVMLMSRFLVGVRGPVYVAAGAVHMPYRRFFAIDLISATLVVTTVFSLSYFFGEPVLAWVRDAEITATVIAAVIFAAVGVFLYRRSKTKIAEIVVGDAEVVAGQSPSSVSRSNPA